MTTALQSKYLDLSALAGLAHLRFTTKRTLEGAYTGRHRSRQQGGAGEFVDFRDYTPGEDLRRLDWKVLGRTGRAYLKRYQDETNLRCMMAADVSGSMGFTGLTARSMSKLEYAKYFMSALAYLVAAQQDQVGLALIREDLEACIEPGSTSQRLAEIYGAVERVEARGGSGLERGLHALFQRMVRRGALVVLSDFLADEPERIFAPVRLFRHQHWEVLVLHLLHPEEERLPEGTAYRFLGMEGESAVDCAPADVRGLYQERLAAHGALVRSLALAAGCDYRRVSTGVSYLDTLGEFLVERTG